MIDIHHHLLFGMDDGAKSLDVSVDMAKMAAEDGITHIVCSPHASDQYSFDPARIADHIRELRHQLDLEKIPVTLGLGCDFHMSYDNIQEAKADPARFSINGLGYLLAELPDYGISQGLTEIFYQMQLAGLTPILTHPERNSTLQCDPQRMIEWMRGGVLVQITAGSVLGNMGTAAQRMAHQLLKDRWVHFVATDAHNTTSRPPKMRAAYELIASKYGPDYAERLCVRNPLAAFLGKPLDVQEEPVGLFEDRQPRSWWQRLLNR